MGAFAIPAAANPPADGSVSPSLLARARAHAPDAWTRLVHLYYPLVQAWGRRDGLRPEDADDFAQEVFKAVATGFANYRPETAPFRVWLQGIAARQLFAARRRGARHPLAVGGSTANERLAELPADDSAASAPPDATGDRTDLMRRALAQLRDGTEERSWQAFWRTAIDGQTAPEVAAALGVSVNAVYLAKARLLRRLRDEYGELLA